MTLPHARRQELQRRVASDGFMTIGGSSTDVYVRSLEELNLGEPFPHFSMCQPTSVQPKLTG